MTDKIIVISPDKDLADVLGNIVLAPGVSATLFKSEKDLFDIYKKIKAIRGEELLNMNGDMRYLLNQLNEHYHADDGHIIRALLKDRIKLIESVKHL